MGYMHYIYTGLAVTGGIILYQALRAILKWLTNDFTEL